MNKILAVVCGVFFLSGTAQAWYVSPPKGFQHNCVWMNPNGSITGVKYDRKGKEILTEIGDGNGCESNEATTTGLRWHKKGHKTCVETTGKILILKVSNRGKEVYVVPKKVSACF